MIFLVGDSHATEIYMAWGDEFPGLTWKTINSYALQNLVRDNNRGAAQEVIRDYLSAIPKQGIIILSYTDVDGRIGFGETGASTVDADYINAIDLIFQIMEPKKLILIDWYSISDSNQPGQTVAPDKRVKNRDAQLSALAKCQIIWKDRLIVSTVRSNLLYENENGFALPWSVADGVHFNFNHEIHRKELFPLMKAWVEEK